MEMKPRRLLLVAVIASLSSSHLAAQWIRHSVAESLTAVGGGDCAESSGGQLFFVQPNELSQLTPLTTPQVSGDFEPLLMANGVFSGTPRVFTVPIDLSVQHAVFSIASEAAVSLAVTRPSGAVVVAGGPGVTIQ